jgi:hypothetical protein
MDVVSNLGYCVKSKFVIYTGHLLLLGQGNLGRLLLAGQVVRMVETRNTFRILVGKQLGERKGACRITLNGSYGDLM